MPGSDYSLSLAITATNSAGAAISNFINSLGPVGGAIATVGAAVIGIGVASVKMAADYQQGMNKIQALTGSSNAQMTQYDAGLKKLAVDAGVAPKALADGLYNVISAGYSGGNAMKMLTLATEDAKIGMTDSGTTAKALTNVMANFNVKVNDATRVNGEMLQTVTLGKATFADYANNITKAAGTSAQFGVSMETMNAAWATLTANGISAGQATTDYDQSLSVMYGNIGTVTKSLQKNGIAFNEAKFNALDYGGKVQMLNAALQQAHAKHVAITGATKQASQAIKEISDHIKMYNGDLSSLSDKQAMAQKTQQAWAITQQGFAQQMSRLHAAVQVVMIDIGNVFLPVLTKMAAFVTDHLIPGLSNLVHYFSLFDLGPITYAWKQLTGAVQNALGPIGGASGVMSNLSPILVDLRNGFSQFLVAGIKGIADIISNIAHAINSLFPPAEKAHEAMVPLTDAIDRGSVVFDKFKGAVTPLTDAIDRGSVVFDKFKNAGQKVSEVTSPLKQVGDVLMGLGKAALNMDPLVNIIEGIARHGKELGQWWQQSVIPAMKQAAPGFKNLGQALAGLIPAFEQVAQIVHNNFQKAFDALLPVFKKAVPIIIQIAGIIANGLGAAIKFLTPYIVQAAAAIGQFASDIATRVAPIIMHWLDQTEAGIKWFQQNWNTIWEALGPLLEGIWQQITGIIKIAWAIVSGIIKIGLDLMSGNWKQAWTDVQDMFKGIWDGIVTYFHGAWNIIRGVVMTIVNVVKALFQGLSNSLVGHSIIPDMINGIVSWFQQLPGRVGAWVQTMANNVKTTISNLAAQATTWGVDLVQNLINGITSMLGNLSGSVQNVASTIASMLHFTHPSKGPLMTVEQWMPHLGDTLIMGLNNIAPKLQASALKAAASVAGPIKGSADGSMPSHIFDFIGSNYSGYSSGMATTAKREEAAQDKAARQAAALAKQEASVESHIQKLEQHYHITLNHKGKWTKADATELAKLMAEETRLQGKHPQTASGRRN